MPETILPNPTNNANIEFLGSFDVPKTPFTNEPNELLFSISRRPQELFNDDDISDDEPSTQGKVVDGCPSSSSSSAQTRMTDKKIDSKPWNLPPPPDFKNIFVHTKEEHAAQADVPHAFQLDGELSPLTLFTLFFSDSVCSQIAVNTNAYAASKGAGEVEGSRHWEDTTLGDIHIFLGILVYMGIFRLPCVEDYWSTNPSYPQHSIAHFMTLVRFQQLKRFLHVSHPDLPEEHWYSKVEPLTTKLAQDFARYYIPSSNVSIDEMIVRFSGRSSHTVRVKGKPTPEGYKIIALCQAGYTYSFLYTSRINSIVGVEKINGLTMTSSAVVHLAKTLPFSTHHYNIYMDNYFSNIPLFTYLRQLQIGACGTVRINSAGFPKRLKVPKAKKLAWNTLSGIVVNNQVLAVIWMDNALVSMLSTIHKIHMDDNFIERIRRCPRNTSTNAANARAVFNGNPTAPLKIPKLIDDYNHNKNGVDLSDQFRSYYCTQLTVVRTWMPLCFWILDTTIVNSYRIYAVRKGTLTHKEYRFNLAWALIASGALNQHHSMMKKHKRECDATSDNHPRKTMHVTKNTELPPSRFVPGFHYGQYSDTRELCLLCRYRATVLKDKSYKSSTQTNWVCKDCKVPLCMSKARNCFEDFHQNSKRTRKHMKNE